MKILKNVAIECNINGCVVNIPCTAHFVTIDQSGNMQIWSQRPFMFEGCWTGDVEEGFLIAKVELDDDDVWTKIFDVSQNCFVARYQY